MATRQRHDGVTRQEGEPLTPQPSLPQGERGSGGLGGAQGARGNDGALAARFAAWKEQARRQLGGEVERATYSGFPVAGVHTPLDVADQDYLRDLGLPGEYPFTRGVHATGYRGKPWTMRIFAGFGTAEETNARFKYLLAHGESGLSVAFDLPTLYGYDTDHPLAMGEFGKCGVAVSSLADMELLFDGIPVDQITTSMTINGPAAVIWAMYIAAAEKRGIAMEQLGGTIQNDILKEFIAQKEWIFPPRPHLRLVVDTIEFGTRHLPRWNTISVSGYHIREAGSTALQELAFTLADGKAYVEAALERGLQIDDFAPRISFFFNADNNFFEEVAKYRAARRIWARELRERYGAQNPRSLWLRFHTQTAGVTCTAQQPENNVVRIAMQALAAVMGGTQSLHTNSLDEALALPSEKAVQIALRTQQIILHETGVPDTVDPLGGSYYVEWLTDQMERGCDEYFARIEQYGGVIPAIEAGFFQREIAEAAFRYQQAVEAKRQIIVGVNEYVTEETLGVPLLRVDEASEVRQIDRLRRVRRERSPAEVARCLRELERAARGRDNLMLPILDAVRAYATLGEICDVLRGVFGEYQEMPVL
ncbi:MAG: methylmalonyl-CoA mutase [Chloroflexi bacterium]|nr:methylmalonyl-CoA mutase [Chloroflexota bacterium]